LGNLRGRSLGIDGRIILKRILDKYKDEISFREA
jgi:hypothetical protein